MRVLMLAPPGAGKGTQGTRVAEAFGVPHIATGDLLRAHVRQGTPLGESVRSFLDRGELVPDQVVLDILREALIASKQSGGYVVDGFPRTLEQARAGYELGKELGVNAEAVLHLVVDDDEVVRRLLARAQTEGRSDDTEDVIRRRLDVYHSVTSPLVGFYRRRGILIDIDATGDVDEITEDILSKLRTHSAAAGQPGS